MSTINRAFRTLTIAGLLAAATTASAYAAMSSLSGTIIDEHGTPVPGIAVNVDGSRTVYTDRHGRFSLIGLDAGYAVVQLAAQDMKLGCGFYLRPNETASLQLVAIRRQGELPVMYYGCPTQFQIDTQVAGQPHYMN